MRGKYEGQEEIRKGQVDEYDQVEVKSKYLD